MKVLIEEVDLAQKPLAPFVVMASQNQGNPQSPRPRWSISRANLIVAAISAVSAALAVYFLLGEQSFGLGRQLGSIEKGVERIEKDIEELQVTVTRIDGRIRTDMASKRELKRLIRKVDDLHRDAGVLREFGQTETPPWFDAWPAEGDIALGPDGDELVIAAANESPVHSPFNAKVESFGNGEALLAYAYAPEWTVRFRNVRCSVEVGQELEPGALVGKFAAELGNGLLRFAVLLNGKPVDPRSYIPLDMGYRELKPLKHVRKKETGKGFLEK